MKRGSLAFALSVLVLLVIPQGAALAHHTGDEGCTLGYWKNHLGAWSGYSPNQSLESVFDVPDAFGLDNVSLVDALSFPGGPGLVGGAQILLKQAVAALLNAAHPGVDYPLTVAQVISRTNAALASGSRSTMISRAGQFDTFNNLGSEVCD